MTPIVAWLFQTTAGDGFWAAPMGRMGEGPSGIIDYVVVALAVLAVGVAIVLAVRWLIRPGEEDPHHIKRRILDDD